MPRDARMAFNIEIQKTAIDNNIRTRLYVIDAATDTNRYWANIYTIVFYFDQYRANRFIIFVSIRQL